MRRRRRRSRTRSRRAGCRCTRSAKASPAARGGAHTIPRWRMRSRRCTRGGETCFFTFWRRRREMTTTVALVIETNNAPVGHLLARLAEQSRPLSTLAEVVVTHDGALDGAAIPGVRLVRLPPGAG